MLDEPNRFPVPINFGKTMDIEVPDPISIRHIEITRVNTAVGFYDILEGADTRHSAALGGISPQYAHQIVKIPDGHELAPGDIVVPQIE